MSRKKSKNKIYSSKYLEKGLSLYFDKKKARKFLPIVFDPNGHGLKPKPDGIYYRILRNGNEDAIQYFIHWKEQDCTRAYPGMGYLFSHDFDYEPIIIFIENKKVKKLVISAAGNLLQGGHQTEIFRKDESIAIGKVTFKTSKRPQYPYGINAENTHFKEDSLKKVSFNKSRPVLGLATCYHVYTTVKKYLQGSKLKLELFELSDDVLFKWFKEENFGHDVSNPWNYPHIRYHPSPKIKRLIDDRSRARLYRIEDNCIINGLTYLDRLRSAENPHRFWETLDPNIDHRIWPQSQYLMYALFTLLGRYENADQVKSNNNFYENAGDRPGKAIDRFCILVNDQKNFAYDRIELEAEGGAADCIALMGIYSLLDEKGLKKILFSILRLFGIKPKSESYFNKLIEMYDPKFGFFPDGELYKLSLFGIFSKKINDKEWSDILEKRIKETQSENGGWKTHWIGPTKPRPKGTVENLESTALSIIAL